MAVSAAYFIGLQCVTCGRQFEAAANAYTCPQCGPILGTLDVLYDYPAIAKQIDRQSLSKNHLATIWRYLPLLPIASPDWLPSLAVGWTPLYAAPRLAARCGLRDLWIKDEGRNPTASMKDRASAVAIVKAKEAGATLLTAASTGNAASSWAAFAAEARLEAVIFVPLEAPEPKVAQILLFGAKVIQVRGNYDAAFDLCCRAAEKWGWYNRSTSINPYLGEGKKTAALEICEQLHWQPPDLVFVPVGDGCIFQGIWKGFQDFYRLNLIDRLPRMVGVQAQGSAPLVTAWQENAERTTTIVPDTFADGIAVGLPRDQIKALRAVRQSNGFFVAVSDDEIMAAMRDLATDAAVFAEPGGAAGIAGLNKTLRQGRCRPQDRVVVVVTGNGLKDVAGVMKAVSRSPSVVDNSLTAVAKALS